MDQVGFYWLAIFGSVVPAYFLAMWWHGLPWDRPRYSHDFVCFVVFSILYQAMQEVPLLEGDGPFVPGLSSALAFVGILFTLGVIHPDHDNDKPGWFITFMTVSIGGHCIWLALLRR